MWILDQGEIEDQYWITYSNRNNEMNLDPSYTKYLETDA